jgi:DNA transformation protein
MSRAVHELRNLGPKTARKLIEIGIHDESDLRKTGSVAAYKSLKFVYGREITLVALYALEAALRDCDWCSLDEETKERLRREK